MQQHHFEPLYGNAFVVTVTSTGTSVAVTLFEVRTKDKTSAYIRDGLRSTDTKETKKQITFSFSRESQHKGVSEVSLLYQRFWLTHFLE
jgi:hypothetical protein